MMVLVPEKSMSFDNVSTEELLKELFLRLGYNIVQERDELRSMCEHYKQGIEKLNAKLDSFLQTHTTVEHGCMGSSPNKNGDAFDKTSEEVPRSDLTHFSRATYDLSTAIHTHISKQIGAEEYNIVLKDCSHSCELDGVEVYVSTPLTIENEMPTIDLEDAKKKSYDILGNP
jgi:hypothetical protein